MEIDEAKIKQMISDAHDQRELDNQYQVSPIPMHTHNGSDASSISLRHAADYGMSKGAYFTKEVDNLNSGTAKTINWNAGNKQKITTTGSCTITFANPQGPCNLVLRVIHENSATVYTYVWPTTVKWVLGAVPATTNTANAIDIISFYFDGANYYGAGLTNFS